MSATPSSSTSLSKDSTARSKHTQSDDAINSEPDLNETSSQQTSCHKQQRHTVNDGSEHEDALDAEATGSSMSSAPVTSTGLGQPADTGVTHSNMEECQAKFVKKQGMSQCNSSIFSFLTSSGSQDEGEMACPGIQALPGRCWCDMELQYGAMGTGVYLRAVSKINIYNHSHCNIIFAALVSRFAAYLATIAPQISTTTWSPVQNSKPLLRKLPQVAMESLRCSNPAWFHSFKEVPTQVDDCASTRLNGQRNAINHTACLRMGHTGTLYTCSTPVSRCHLRTRFLLMSKMCIRWWRNGWQVCFRCVAHDLCEMSLTNCDRASGGKYILLRMAGQHHKSCH